MRDLENTFHTIKIQVFSTLLLTQESNTVDIDRILKNKNQGVTLTLPIKLELLYFEIL